MKLRLYLSFLLCISCFFPSAYAEGENDDHEKEAAISRSEIKSVIDSLTTRQKIAQLLVVGMPADLGNYKTNKDLRELGSMGVGGFVANTYNYIGEFGEDELEMRLVRDFHQEIVSRYQRAGLPPPLIFTNYESRSVSGLSTVPVPHPPGALTLAATRDRELVELAGLVAGRQLNSLGIDAVFGPVVDIDDTAQGVYNAFVTERSFGGSSELVIGAASNYLRGLEKAGVLPFLKHFPGHGMVAGDEKQVDYPEFNGSVEVFERNLAPFRELLSRGRGVMTSHLKTNIGDSELVTFSRVLTHNLIRSDYTSRVRGLNRPESLVITDDLSSMGAIQKYLEDRQDASMATVSREAILAGHDLLLFAHFEPHGHFGGLSMEELNQILDELAEWAEIPENYETYIEPSLQRLLYAKAKRMRRLKPDADTNSLAKWRTPDFESLGFKLKRGEKLVSPETVYNEIAARALFSVRKVQNSSDLSQMSGARVFAIVSESCRPTLGNFLESPARSFRLDIEYSEPGNSESFRKVRELIELASKGGFDYFLYDYVPHTDSSHLIDYLLSKVSSKSERRDVFIFLHGSPRRLKDPLLNPFNIVSNFERGDYACRAFSEYLRNGGKLQNDNADTPITIGSDGRWARAEDVTPFPGLGPALRVSVVGSREEHLLDVVEKVEGELEEAKHRIEEVESALQSRNKEKESFREAVLWHSRLAGSILFGIGCLGAIYLIRRALLLITLPGEPKMANLAATLFWAMFRESFRRLVGFGACGFVMAVGIMLVFSIGPGDIYQVLQSRVDSLAAKESASEAEPTGTTESEESQ